MYIKELMSREEYNIQVDELYINEDFIPHKTYMYGYYILSGSLIFNNIEYKQNNFIWIEGGEYTFNTHGAHLLSIESNKPLNNDNHYSLFNIDDIDYNLPDHEKIRSKYILKAEDYGIKFQLSTYSHNLEHEWHTHECAHGMYILDGQLEMRLEDSIHVYKPGDFVCIKQNTPMSHTYYKQPVTLLLITNGLFDYTVIDNPSKYNNNLSYE